MSATTAHAVITPAPRRVLARALVFVGIGLFLLAIVLISIGAGRQAVAGIPFSATNAAPEGSMAIAEVLRQQGVKVTAAASLTEAASAVKDRSRSTLLIYDPKGFLSDLNCNRPLASRGTSSFLIRVSRSWEPWHRPLRRPVWSAEACPPTAMCPPCRRQDQSPGADPASES